MKKFLNGVIAIIVCSALVISSNLSAFAASNSETQTCTKYEPTSSGYLVYTVTTSNGPSDQAKKLDALGFKKTDNVSGTISVSKTQTHTFSATATVSAEYNAGFGSVGASLSIGASYSTSVCAGTSVTIESGAKNGTYYAYVCIPRKKVSFTVQTCSKNHTSWYTKYKKNIAAVPMVGYEYLEVKRVY